MITLCLVLLVLVALVIIILALAGIIAVAWPVLIILGVGAIIDFLVLKLIFRKK